MKGLKASLVPRPYRAILRASWMGGELTPKDSATSLFHGLLTWLELTHDNPLLQIFF